MRGRAAAAARRQAAAAAAAGGPWGRHTARCTRRGSYGTKCTSYGESWGSIWSGWGCWVRARVCGPSCAAAGAQSAGADGRAPGLGACTCHEHQDEVCRTHSRAREVVVAYGWACELHGSRLCGGPGSEGLAGSRTEHWAPALRQLRLASGLDATFCLHGDGFRLIYFGD